MGYSIVVTGSWSQSGRRWGVGVGSGAAACAVMPCSACYARGHISVVMAIARDSGRFVPLCCLCWLCSAPGEADHDGSSFSLGLSRQPCFPRRGVWGRAGENSVGESRRWQVAGMESGAGVCSWSRSSPLVHSFSSVWRPWMLFKAQTRGKIWHLKECSSEA